MENSYGDYPRKFSEWLRGRLALSQEGINESQYKAIEDMMEFYLNEAYRQGKLDGICEYWSKNQ